MERPENCSAPPHCRAPAALAILRQSHSAVIFVQLSRNRGNEEKREAGGQGEFSVGLAARRDASPMSRHKKQRSVEEGRSLLGGTHAMKSVKPSIHILEGHSTGVNMDVS